MPHQAPDNSSSAGDILANTARGGLTLAVVATLLYSLKPILIKLIYQHDGVTSSDVLMWRMIVSLPIYIVIGALLLASIRRKQDHSLSRLVKKNGALLVQVAIIGSLAYYVAALFDLLGLQYITSQLARLILFTHPALVAILSFFLLKQRVTRVTVLALIVAYIGVSLLVFSDSEDLGQVVLLGSFFMFLSALSFSLYVVLSKPLIDKMGSQGFTVVAMLASSVCIVLHHFFAEGFVADISIATEPLLLIAAMALLTTVLPAFLLASAIGRLGPQRTSIVGSVGPVLTSLLAVMVLSEPFGVAQLVSLAMVIGAILLMERQRPQQEV